MGKEKLTSESNMADREQENSSVNGGGDLNLSEEILTKVGHELQVMAAGVGIDGDCMAKDGGVRHEEGYDNNSTGLSLSSPIGIGDSTKQPSPDYTLGNDLGLHKATHEKNFVNPSCSGPEFSNELNVDHWPIAPFLRDPRSTSLISEGSMRRIRKKSVRTLVDIESQLHNQLSKKVIARGRKARKNQKTNKKRVDDLRIINDSLSDGDFQNRRRILHKEAIETWEVGKMPELSVNCDEQLVIQKIMELEAKSGSH